MKQILQLQSKKIEACEENNYQGLITNDVDVYLTKNIIRLNNGDGNRIVIHIDEFLQLCDYVKENNG